MRVSKSKSATPTGTYGPCWQSARCVIRVRGFAKSREGIVFFPHVQECKPTGRRRPRWHRSVHSRQGTRFEITEGGQHGMEKARRGRQSSLPRNGPPRRMLDFACVGNLNSSYVQTGRKKGELTMMNQWSLPRNGLRFLGKKTFLSDRFFHVLKRGAIG